MRLPGHSELYETMHLPGHSELIHWIIFPKLCSCTHYVINRSAQFLKLQSRVTARKHQTLLFFVLQSQSAPTWWRSATAWPPRCSDKTRSVGLTSAPPVKTQDSRHGRRAPARHPVVACPDRPPLLAATPATSPCPALLNRLALSSNLDRSLLLEFGCGLWSMAQYKF
jgi:hypothetical protein